MADDIVLRWEDYATYPWLYEEDDMIDRRELARPEIARAARAGTVAMVAICCVCDTEYREDPALPFIAQMRKEGWRYREFPSATYDNVDDIKSVCPVHVGEGDW